MEAKAKKRALVLGCGGVAGAAWTTATLSELERVLGWDAREADVLIGTSAGALAAALLGAGVSVSQLMKSQRGELEADCWDHARDWGSGRPPVPSLRFTAPRFWSGVMRGRVSLATAFTGLLPEGRAGFASFERLFARVLPEQRWVSHKATWIMVADVDSGERVAFGKPGSPLASISSAVSASYAVPGWYTPIRIGERTYVDGGVVSPTSADLLLGSDITEAIVLAPMAAREPASGGARRNPFAEALRMHMTRIVDREVKALQAAKIRVIRLDPSNEDIAAFGINLMDPRRRLGVLETAIRTAPRAVESALQLAE
ncbi:MAG: patatin-like phospholipase family protein [Myxococcales bacterium]